MQSRISNSFMVYNSSAYIYIRFVVIAAPFLCCWLANSTQALWLYGAGIIMAIIAGYVIILLGTKVILNSDGITIIKNFQRTYISWEKIVFVENITLLPYGFLSPVEIVCFSTQKQNPSTISKSKYLPQLSKDFIFIMRNNHARKIISEVIPNNVAKRLKINACVIDNNERAFQPLQHNKWIIVCVLYTFVLLVAYLLIQLQ